MLNNQVRRRNSQFPISTGKEFGTLQPAALAHVDFTVREGERLIEVMYGERAVEVLRGHWQINKRMETSARPFERLASCALRRSVRRFSQRHHGRRYCVRKLCNRESANHAQPRPEMVLSPRRNDFGSLDI